MSLLLLQAMLLDGDGATCVDQHTFFIWRGLK